MDTNNNKKEFVKEANFASKVNNIDIKTATNADWTLLYSYIESATKILAHSWCVFDDYPIEETVCMVAEKVCKSKDNYNPAFCLTTWLSTIIKNTLIDNLDKAYDRKNKLESITDNEDNLIVDMADDDYLPDNYDNALNLIYSYLDGLDDTSKKIMVMHMKGYNSDQISKAICKSVNAVNIKICRLRKEIRDKLRTPVLEVLFQTA